MQFTALLPFPFAACSEYDWGMQGRSGTATETTPAEVRRILTSALVSDEHLNAFCLDHFPDIFRLFSAGQNRLAKENLLLSLVSPEEIVLRLQYYAQQENSYHIRGGTRQCLAPAYERASFDSMEAAHFAAIEVAGRRPVPPPRSAYDASWYVPRTEQETRIIDSLSFPGAAVALLAPMGFGKTWMLEHLLLQLQERGHIVSLDLRAFADSQTMQNFSRFLRDLAHQILMETSGQSAADVAGIIGEAWRYSTNPIDNLNRIMRRLILPTFSKKWLILALDDVDTLRKHPYLEDFFTLLRSWMENACHPPWGALRLIMTLSMPPQLLIANVHQSPFNNAIIIELREFERAQINQLCRIHGLAWSEEEVDLVQTQIGGHPYLLKMLLCEAHRSRKSAAELLSVNSLLFEDLLASRQRWLAARPALRDTFLAVASGRSAFDFFAVEQLCHEGLLRRTTRHVELRHAIYLRLLDRLEGP